MNKLLIATALVVGLASGASAATITFTQTLGDQTTDFADRTVASIQRFDSQLGTLNAATITLEGTVAGSVSYESLDAASSNVTLNLSAQVTLSTASLGSLVVVLPTLTEIRSVTAFDGVVDFSGTSGGAVSGLLANQSDSATLTGASLAGFIGAGFVDFTLDGFGLSNATGPGNLATIFQTAAGGIVTVTYDYTALPPAPVPLPAALPLLFIAMGALGAVARRKA
jgi:hypothetical protein